MAETDFNANMVNIMMTIMSQMIQEQSVGNILVSKLIVVVQEIIRWLIQQ